MTMTDALLLGILPAAWMLWARQVVRVPATTRPAAQRRFFLLAGGLILTLLLPTIVYLVYGPHLPTPEIIVFLMVLLTPALCSAFAIFVIGFLERHSIFTTRGTRILAILLAPFVLGLATVAAFGVPFAGTLVCDALVIAVVWQLWSSIGRWRPVLYIIETGWLAASIRATDLHSPTLDTPVWLSLLVQTSVYLAPAAAMALAARLLLPELDRHATEHWRGLLARVLLTLPLLALVAYELLLMTVWDVATDGLGGSMLWLQVSVSVMAAAVVLAWSLSGRRRWVALALAIIIPVLMVNVQDIGNYAPSGKWGMMPTLITQRRADVVNRAVLSYYARNSRYPQALDNLTPLYLLYVPTPLIIPGKTWCYEGGQDYYRLGYVYRQYFSSPRSVRVHASVGEPPTASLQCP